MYFPYGPPIGHMRIRHARRYKKKGKKAGGGGGDAGDSEGGVEEAKGSDGPPDPLKDSVAELLRTMHTDFIIAKLRPSCSACHACVARAHACAFP